MNHSKKGTFMSSIRYKTDIVNHYPIEEPNFTQIPNVIFDYWMSRLTPSTFKVLIYFHMKINPKIPTPTHFGKIRIKKETGISKYLINKAIKELEHEDLIYIYSRQEHSGNCYNTYTLKGE